MSRSIAIIGAGISGLTAARILRSKGYMPVVYEKHDRPGGLVRCSIEEGNLFHRVGGIVFNTKNERIKKWFAEQFDLEKEFIVLKRNAKISMNGQLLGYPIENYLYQLPDRQKWRIFRELLLLPLKSNHSVNFEAFLRNRFGETLYEIYFGPYNSKIWNFDLKQIPLPWLEGKLPMPRVIEILIDNIFRKQENKMVHSTFFYPVKGGSAFIAERLAEGLEISYNFHIDKIERSGQKWMIDKNAYDAVIYTGDVRLLSKLLTFSAPTINESLSDLTTLPANGTSNVLCYTDDTDLTWLYFPGSDVRAHRIVYTGNLSSHNNSGQRKTCLVEFSGKLDETEMREEIKKLPGNLDPIAFSYESDSYVIQLQDTRDKIARLKKELNLLNFHLAGRFAEWEYYNMDKAMLAAMKVCDLL